MKNWLLNAVCSLQYVMILISKAILGWLSLVTKPSSNGWNVVIRINQAKSSQKYLFDLQRIPEYCGIPEIGFDFQKPVIFGYPLATGNGARFNLSPTHGYGKIGNKGVFRFPATVGYDISLPGFMTKTNCFHCFTDSANLVKLDQYSVGAFF